MQHFFLDNKFEYIGTPLKSTQALAFPRKDDSGEDLQVPLKIKYACIELALIIPSDLLFDDKFVGSQIISEKIAEIEVKYKDVSRTEYKIVRYNFIKKLIKDYLAFGDDSQFERA